MASILKSSEDSSICSYVEAIETQISSYSKRTITNEHLLNNRGFLVNETILGYQLRI